MFRRYFARDRASVKCAQGKQAEEGQQDAETVGETENRFRVQSLQTPVDDYFFVQCREKAVCLICKDTVAVFKEFNICRHYETATESSMLARRAK